MSKPTVPFPENPTALSATSAKVKSPMRYVVPLALLSAIIGGIAWVVQNMPSWRKTAVTAAPTVIPDALLGFTHFAKDGTYYAFWERPKETDKVPYSREYERGAEGRYYFHCINMVEEPVDLALAFKSCDCAKLFVALITPE